MGTKDTRFPQVDVFYRTVISLPPDIVILLVDYSEAQTVPALQNKPVTHLLLTKPASCLVRR